MNVFHHRPRVGTELAGLCCSCTELLVLWIRCPLCDRCARGGLQRHSKGLFAFETRREREPRERVSFRSEALETFSSFSLYPQNLLAVVESAALLPSKVSAPSRPYISCWMLRGCWCSPATCAGVVEGCLCVISASHRGSVSLPLVLLSICCK